MSFPTPFYLLIFGILTILGGIIGFLKANSKPSLIGGLISGALLIVSAKLMGTHFLVGSILGLIICGLLIIQFIQSWRRRGKTMPAVPMIVLSVIGIVLIIREFF